MTCFSLTVLFFEKKSRQKKLWLSGTIYRVFRLPCVKGAVGASRLRDCFFTTLQPLRGFRTPLGEACKCASHTRKSLPPLRGPPPLTHGRRIPNPSRPCLQALSQTEKTSPALSRGRGFFSFYISVLLILDSCLSCRKTCDRHAER